MAFHIEEYKEVICVCSRCGNCYGEAALEPSDVCFLRKYYGGWESYGPRGKLKITRYIMDGKLKYTDALSDRVYADLLCKRV